MTATAPPRRAAYTISDLAARASNADDIRAMLNDGVKQLEADAKAAQIAADRFRSSAERYKRIERELWQAMNSLATDLHDMKLDAERRKK